MRHTLGYANCVSGLTRTFLTAQWLNLAMLNYEVDPGLLTPFVPAGTELDSWNGKTFLSLVGFRFLRTRVFGIPFPFHCNFNEVNLRFYVRRREGRQVKRGVVFIREIVPRRAIALVARAFYGERYVALPMSHVIESADANLRVEYAWKLAGSWSKINLSVEGIPALPGEGSLEQFITEHYWGYAEAKKNATIEYEVRHPQWKVWRAWDAAFSGNMECLYGEELNAVLRRPPDSAFLAEGSPVSVQRGSRLLWPNLG